jgi:tetratricopeptide (TPR) repeat protein
MKSRTLSALVAVSLAAGLSSGALAADLKLPRPSPKAEVIQTVGITDFRITYSRPGVKGRTIWGELVPYDKVWRTGANEATTFTASTDVKIAGQPLPAGSYSLHTIPTAGAWTIIFNKASDLWGSYAYNDSLDVLRVQVTPVAHEATEWMTFSFPEIGVETATLALDWDKLRVAIPIQVETVTTALASVRAAMASVAADDATTPFRAADFAFNNNVALEDAMVWVDQAIAIKPSWLNLRLKANMLAKQGKTKEAIAAMEQAIEVGKNCAPPEEIAKLETTVKEWKSQL